MNRTIISRTVKAVAPFAVVLAGILSQSASAALLIYTDRASFLSAAGGGLLFESFEGTPQAGESVPYGALTFVESGGANFITHTAINGYFTAATTHGNHSIWYDDNDDSVSTLTFGFASPVNALGLDITVNVGGTLAIGGDISANLSLVSNTPSFFGVISTDSFFNSVTFAASEGPEVGFDAVHFGRASTGVPEGGATLLLLSVALGALCSLRRRIAW